MLVERSLGGRNPAIKVQGSRSTWRVDGRWTTLCPRGLEGSLGSKCPATTSRSCDHLSWRYRGLSSCPGSPGSIHAPTGSSLLGHSRVNFTKAGSYIGHSKIRFKKRFSCDAETQSRAGVRRPRETHARTEDLSHVTGIFCRDTRDQEAQTRFQ